MRRLILVRLPLTVHLVAHLLGGRKPALAVVTHYLKIVLAGVHVACGSVRVGILRFSARIYLRIIYAHVFVGPLQENTVVATSHLQWTLVGGSRKVFLGVMEVPWKIYCNFIVKMFVLLVEQELGVFAVIRIFCLNVELLVVATSAKGVATCLDT